MKKLRSILFYEAEKGGGTGASGEPSATSLLGGAPGGGEATKTGDGAPSGDVSYIGADGAFTDGWIDALGDEYKDAKPTLERYKTFPELVKGLHHANQALGKKGVAVPTKDSTPEEVAAYRKAVGAPESADKYVFKPEKLPEGMEWSDDAAKPYADWAHKYNIPQAAVSELVGLHVASRQGETQMYVQALEQQYQDGLTSLRQAWGPSFDKNLALAERGAVLAGVDPKTIGFSDPAIVQGFVKLVGMLGEDKLPNKGSELGQSGKTPHEEAQDIITNPENPLHKAYHEGDEDANSKVVALLKQASGTKKK